LQKNNATQQSGQRGGWDFEPFPPQPLITQAIETVEKVPFQKLIFEKWDRNIEKRLVFYVSNNNLAIYEPFLSLLWEFFVKIFQTKGFSTVSLGDSYVNAGIDFKK